MAKAKQVVFREATIKQLFMEAIFRFTTGIGFDVWRLIAYLVCGTFLASGTFVLPDLLLTTDFGRFCQTMAVFFLVNESIFFARTGSISRLTTFSGVCPYCGTANDLIVLHPTQSRGKNCSKCKKRFVLKDGEFCQLDSPSLLDAKFAVIKNGIGLVHKGIAIACLVPITFVAVVILGNLLFIFAPVKLLIFVIFSPFVLLLISVSVQIFGAWQCLQTPDRISAKRWITATVWLKGIVLILLVSKFLFVITEWPGSPDFILEVLVFGGVKEAALLPEPDLLLEGVSFAGQFTFLIFLIKLSTFTQRGDLAVEFEDLLVATSSVFVGLLVGPLVPASYKQSLFPILTFFGFVVLLRYLGNLKRLETHLGKAIAAR